MGSIIVYIIGTLNRMLENQGWKTMYHIQWYIMALALLPNRIIQMDQMYK